MIEFEFESHEHTPDDQYIKEIVTLKFTVRSPNSAEIFYLPYFKKSGKDGRSFWDVASTSITKHGEKKYDDKFSWDSRHREKQIKTFLDSRAWERTNHVQPQASEYYPNGLIKQSPPPAPPPTSMSEAAMMQEEIPF